MLSFDSIDPIVDLDAGGADVDDDTSYPYVTVGDVETELRRRFDIPNASLVAMSQMLFRHEMDPRVPSDTAAALYAVGYEPGDYGYNYRTQQWR